MAAADHQVLGAAGDPEIAVFVETAKIARIDPIAVNERPLVVRLIEITAEYPGPAMLRRRFRLPRIALEAAVGIELDDTNAA